MPIVEVTVGPKVDDSVIARLRDVLPEAVSLAVECPEEPYDGELKPGDVEIHFRPNRSPGPQRARCADRGPLEVVRQPCGQQAGANRSAVSAIAESLNGLALGVFLTLPVAAWSQTD